MPVFFQDIIDADTRLGIWKIEENEHFFLSSVPLQQEVRHPHKRLQHLAGRFLLRYLFPDFPYDLIRIADTRKPFLENEAYHFSISHCGDYAAAIVSKIKRVGVDIEMPSEKVEMIRNKFLSGGEQKELAIGNEHALTSNFQLPTSSLQLITLLWCAKESVFKWYGDGGVDFRRHIILKRINSKDEMIDGFFHKTNQKLSIRFRLFDHIVLTWTST